MKICKCRMMKNVQMLAFSVHETVLYLDGHPNDKKALAYYYSQNEKLKQAVAAYESQFGPLTYKCVKDQDSWTWTKGPWPWEYSANVCAE